MRRLRPARIIFATFFLGNGTDHFKLGLDNGVHSFADGLEVRNEALIYGCGTINGNVLVDAGGEVKAGHGACALTINGTVTNNGTVIYNTNGGVIFNDFINNGKFINAGSTAIYTAL